MANMKTLLVGVCALAGLVQAAPIADVTLTNTVTHTAYKTKNCVATVWLPAGQSPIAPSSSSGQSTTFRTSFAPRPSPSTSTRTIEYTTQPPAPAPTTASAYVPPPAPPTSAYVAPTTPPPETTVAPAPAPETTTPAYIPPAPVTTESPAYVAPVVPSSEAPAPAPTTSDPPAAEPSYDSEPGQFIQASASNTCEGTGAACEGDVTHYDGGLGACGWDVNTESDLSVALPVGLMGSQSNGNPYCGRTVTIKNPTSGTTVQAKVGDKCMGCEGRAIDLTNKLFQAVTDGTGDGRESGFQWWFD